MPRRILGAILAILALSVGACNPLRIKWSHDPADTVTNRLKIKCVESGGVWTRYRLRN